MFSEKETQNMIYYDTLTTADNEQLHIVVLSKLRKLVRGHKIVICKFYIYT